MDKNTIRNMSLSTATLHFFLAKINDYEPGIVRMIEDILNMYFRSYRELKMPQIRNLLMLEEMGYSFRFSLSTVRNFNSEKIQKMLSYIENPKNCKFFDNSEHPLLDMSHREDIAEYIQTNMLLYRVNKAFINQISFFDFGRLSSEKIRNMILLIKNGIKQPYVKWYVNENNSSKINTIIEIKKAGFEDIWCAEPIKTHFTSEKIYKMIELRKDPINDNLTDEQIYWIVRNGNYSYY